MQKIIEKIDLKTGIENELGLKYIDLENMFNIYLTDQDNNIFNLNETIYLYVPKSRMQTFRPDHEMPWTLISYKIYKTTRLAWLIIRLNEIKLKDVFKLVRPGDVVYYVAEEDVETIAESLINGQ